MLKFRLKISFLLVQLLLLALIIAALIWAVLSFTFFKDDYSLRLKEKKFKFDSFSKSKGSLSNSDFNLLLKKAQGRDLFVKRIAPKSTGPANSRKIAELVERLQMVGFLSDDPAKAIVQDKKSSKTFYLKQGDVFLDGVKVNNITKNSITIEYYGEIFDLYL